MHLNGVWDRPTVSDTVFHLHRESNLTELDRFTCRISPIPGHAVSSIKVRILLHRLYQSAEDGGQRIRQFFSFILEKRMMESLHRNGG